MNKETDTITIPYQICREAREMLSQIAWELKEITMEEKRLKERQEELRGEAMSLMATGSEIQTAFGKLQYNPMRTGSRLNKKLLKAELLRQGLHKERIRSIIAASSTDITFSQHIVFYNNRKLNYS